MSYQIVALSIAFGLALLAGTFRSVKWNLMLRPPSTSRPRFAALYAFAEGTCWVLSGLTLLAAIPHPVTLLLLMMLVASIVISNRWRYREEAESMNRWLRFTTDGSGISAENESGSSLNSLTEALGRASSTAISKQASRFSYHLDRGRSVANAAYRSKLPVSIATLAAIHASGTPASSEVASSTFSDETEWRNRWSEDSQRSIIEQLIYLAGLMFLACGLSLLIRGMSGDMLSKMMAEFGIEPSELVENATVLIDTYNILMVLLAIWCFFACTVRVLPTALVHLVPWFGRSALDGWRSDLLDALAMGVKNHQAESDLLNQAAEASRVAWTRKRCRKASKLLQKGVAFPVALQRSGVITKRERTWMTLSSENHHLDSAMAQLASDIRRQQLIRWKLRMSWAMPLAIVAVGIYVLAHIASVLQALNDLTLVLS
ncbi:type II secretion system F family protein [Rhodopirellula sp. JC740]|uniref:Type II secretion system F family protein n=1 Tax=Rhodopirellula halodulae TaxID=2894198 RepID=A0ABS8NC59_9BACT|nr:type II secretion system F family protein [Rhodopirellula sp. JC740]